MGKNTDKGGQEDNKEFSSLSFSGRHKSTKAQEEIVGFALIIIIVAVVLLFLLSFTLRSSGKEEVESYEIDSFIQSSLQYTTECGYDHKPKRDVSIQDLIFECIDDKICFEEDSTQDLDEIKSCDFLSTTLREIVGESWKASADRPVKGYEFIIRQEEGRGGILILNEGEVTQNFKGGLQDLPGKIKITLKVYY